MNAHTAVNTCHGEQAARDESPGRSAAGWKLSLHPKANWMMAELGKEHIPPAQLFTLRSRPKEPKVDAAADIKGSSTENHQVMNRPRCVFSLFPAWCSTWGTAEYNFLLERGQEWNKQVCFIWTSVGGLLFFWGLPNFFFSVLHQPDLCPGEPRSCSCNLWQVKPFNKHWGFFWNRETVKRQTWKVIIYEEKKLIWQHISVWTKEMKEE